MPRRPARPVSCVYSPAVSSACDSPLNLTSRSSTTVRAGMLIPSARVSVANTARTSPRTNSSSTVSLNAGSIPAWCAAMPRSRASRHSQYPRTARSACGSSAVRRSTVLRISAASSSVVSRRPDRTHWPTAASQPARLNTNVMAGSRPLRSRRSITVVRDGGRKPVRRGGPPRPRPRPPRSQIAVELCRSMSRVWRTRSGSTCSSPSASSPAKRSSSLFPTIMCCHSGTGRCSSTTTAVSPRTVTSQSPNSSALLTVADRLTSATCSGSWRITSSHTAPRKRSAR